MRGDWIGLMLNWLISEFPRKKKFLPFSYAILLIMPRCRELSFLLVGTMDGMCVFKRLSRVFLSGFARNTVLG